MNTFTRIVCVAVPSWILWAGIIAMSAPQPPSGPAQIVFLASMVIAIAGAVWACWSALPRHAEKKWRRSATIGLGLGAFAIILLIGHTFGALLAQTLAA